MTAIRHATVMLGGAAFHVAEAGQGRPSGELVILLHGFPECWYSWRHLMNALAPNYQVLAPDLRGYNLSDTRAPLSAYTPGALCGDVLALIDHYGAQRCTLVGHDWGGLLAWHVAALHPQVVERLVVLNAPHPNRFQWALDHDRAQRAASGYIERLRAPGVEARLLAGSPPALWEMTMAGLERSGAIGPLERDVYVDGWRRPGAMSAMLNWYRAAPFVLADEVEGEGSDHQHLIGQLHVSAPTLLLWGMRDPILLPLLLDGLVQYVPRLRIERVEDGGHGLLLEQPERTAALIGDFLRTVAR